MICQRVLIINNGRIVAKDSMQNLAESAATTTLDLEVRGPREAVVALLEKMPGVTEVSSQKDAAYVVTLDTREHGPPFLRIEEVAKTLVQAGYGVRRLTKRTRSLEAVFMDAIAERQETAPGPAPAHALAEGDRS
jgi:ABC-type multidrug transport system ATPase subunit